MGANAQNYVWLELVEDPDAMHEGGRQDVRQGDIFPFRVTVQPTDPNCLQGKACLWDHLLFEAAHGSHQQYLAVGVLGLECLGDGQSRPEVASALATGDQETHAILPFLLPSPRGSKSNAGGPGRLWR
jgi:hypothetical protein